MKRSSYSQPGRMSEMLSKSEKMREHAQKLEIIGRLAGGIAHDLNNLLGVIVGHSDLLLSSVELEPKVRRKAEQIQQAGQNAAALTRQLLAFSRQQFDQPAVLSLNELLLQMAGVLRRLLREDIMFFTALDATGGMIMADPAQIQQLVISLVLTASDAMPEGGRLTIQTEDALVDDDIARAFHVSAGRFVRLIVTRASPTTKLEREAPGLGLAAVESTAQQNGGFTVVESHRESGLSFKLYLPVTESRTIPKEALNPSAHSGRKETVLVAEDSATLAALITEILTDEGFTVVMTRDGQEALDACRFHPSPIHLLITDVIMPNMNGRELVDCIKTLRPETKVIFMSGYTADVVIRQEVLKANMGFLEKPFTPSALLGRVREALGKTEFMEHSA